MRGSTHLVCQSVVMDAKTLDEIVPARAMANRCLAGPPDRLVWKLHGTTARRRGESVTPMYVATYTGKYPKSWLTLPSGCARLLLRLRGLATVLICSSRIYCRLHADLSLR